MRRFSDIVRAPQAFDRAGRMPAGRRQERGRRTKDCTCNRFHCLLIFAVTRTAGRRLFLVSAPAFPVPCLDTPLPPSPRPASDRCGREGGDEGAGRGATCQEPAPMKEVKGKAPPARPAPATGPAGLGTSRPPRARTPFPPALALPSAAQGCPAPALEDPPSPCRWLRGRQAVVPLHGGHAELRGLQSIRREAERKACR